MPPQVSQFLERSRPACGRPLESRTGAAPVALQSGQGFIGPISRFRSSTMIKNRSSSPRHLEKRKEAVAAPPPSESKWRELRPRTPFSDPFQRSGGTLAHIPHYGDWSSKAVNQQKGDGSSSWSAATVRPRRAAPMRRELVRPSGRVGSQCGGSPSPCPPLGDASMAIRLRPSEDEWGDDLAIFLSRNGCSAEAAKDGTVTVELPHVLHQKQARMELGLYIRLRQALHGVRVDLLD